LTEAQRSAPESISVPSRSNTSSRRDPAGMGRNVLNIFLLYSMRPGETRPYYSGTRQPFMVSTNVARSWALPALAFAKAGKAFRIPSESVQPGTSIIL
jgi:hypothetical protein